MFAISGIKKKNIWLPTGCGPEKLNIRTPELPSSPREGPWRKKTKEISLPKYVNVGKKTIA